MKWECFDENRSEEERLSRRSGDGLGLRLKKRQSPLEETDEVNKLRMKKRRKESDRICCVAERLPLDSKRKGRKEEEEGEAEEL